MGDGVTGPGQEALSPVAHEPDKATTKAETSAASENPDRDKAIEIRNKIVADFKKAATTLNDGQPTVSNEDLAYLDSETFLPEAIFVAMSPDPYGPNGVLSRTPITPDGLSGLAPVVSEDPDYERVMAAVKMGGPVRYNPTQANDYYNREVMEWRRREQLAPWIAVGLQRKEEFGGIDKVIEGLQRLDNDPYKPDALRVNFADISVEEPNALVQLCKLTTENTGRYPSRGQFELVLEQAQRILKASGRTDTV